MKPNPREEDDIVFCKDCIYYQEEDEPPHITTFMECTRLIGDGKWHFRNDYDTCPFGVRKGTQSK